MIIQEPRGGVTHGQSDDCSFRAAEDSTYWYDVHATILHLLEIDHLRLTLRHYELDRWLTDAHGRVLAKLLA